MGSYVKEIPNKEMKKSFFPLAYSSVDQKISSGWVITQIF